MQACTSYTMMTIPHLMQQEHHIRVSQGAHLLCTGLDGIVAYFNTHISPTTIIIFA